MDAIDPYSLVEAINADPMLPVLIHRHGIERLTPDVMRLKRIPPEQARTRYKVSEAMIRSEKIDIADKIKKAKWQTKKGLPKKEFARPRRFKTPTITPKMIVDRSAIITKMCGKYRVTRSDLFTKKRAKPLIMCRHDIYYHMVKTIGFGVTQTARYFGVDHSSVNNGIKRCAERLGKGQL